MTRQELLARLDRAAKDLEVVQLPMVFVGGATLPLYVDDEAHDLRETKDVDVMVEATSYDEFAELEERLRTAGFQHDTSRNAPRCRWLKGGQQYDIVDVRTDYTSDRWVRATGPGIGEEIEGTVSRGPGITQRVEAVFDRLLKLAVASPNL